MRNHQSPSLLQLISNWRYWPMELLYLPLTLYVFFIGSLRAGRLFYFAAANPKVPMGGFANDSKYAILEKVPAAFKPKTFFVSRHDTIEQVKHGVEKECITFPLIVKPDLGEGGFLVKKIHSAVELCEYHTKHAMDYIVQAYVSYPIELSILLHNADGKLTISSITERVHLSIVGDGVSSVRTLLAAHPRAKYRFKNIVGHCESSLDHLPAKGETMWPTGIGNWDCGATYIERAELAHSKLLAILEELNTQIGLFHYARYDIMCASIPDFQEGKMMVLEINGVKGEPIHIYDEKYTLWQAYVEIFKHWEYIFQISKRNIKAGFECPNIQAGFAQLKKHSFAKKHALTKSR